MPQNVLFDDSDLHLEHLLLIQQFLDDEQVVKWTC